jgi:hypothetical protein
MSGLACGCGTRHRSYGTTAKCIWPGALWVVGKGPYVTLAHCPRGLTVMLHYTLAEATDAKCEIDSFGCGGLCEGDHEIVRLEGLR